MEPRIGFFKYDLFPYVITRTIIGWSDEGDPVVRGGMQYSRRSLIDTLPQDRGDKVAALIDEIRDRHRAEERELRLGLLAELHNAAPFLKPATE